MLTEEDIKINKFAQGKLTIAELLDWFDSLSLSYQRQVLTWTRIYLEQSHPDESAIEKGLHLVPLKPTVTPIVLFKTHPFNTAAQKVNSLPDFEVRKGFITIVTLFKFSDTLRREKYCKNGCHHDWHNLD